MTFLSTFISLSILLEALCSGVGYMRGRGLQMYRIKKIAGVRKKKKNVAVVRAFVALQDRRQVFERNGVTWSMCVILQNTGKWSRRVGFPFLRMKIVP